MQKWFVLSLIFLLNINFSFAQLETAFERGYEAGYKKAHPNCFSTPYPVYSYPYNNTYEDGFSVGYEKGLADKKEKKQQQNTGLYGEPINQSNQQRQNNVIPKTESYDGGSSMGKMLREKQKNYNRQTTPNRASSRPSSTYTPVIYPVPNWDSYSRIKKSFCSISLKTNQNKITFTTRDNLQYEVWYGGERIGEFSRYSNLVFNNIRRGTYPFKVYYLIGKRKKQLRTSDTWMLSTKSTWVINVTNQIMGFN